MGPLGYKPCLTDPDLCYKPMVRPEDGFKYYTYMLLYVDDCLCEYHDAMSALHELDYYFKMKSESIGDPDIYLGGKLRWTVLPNNVEAWGLSPSKYTFQKAVKNVESYLDKNFNW